MFDLNSRLFGWLAAGYQPNAEILPLAMSAALWGAWLGAAVIAWAAWKNPAQRRYLLTAVAAAALAGVLSHSLASSLAFPRPFMLHLSPAYIAHGSRGALPSTHATVMFSLAAILYLRLPLRPVAWQMFGLAIFTAWGRIYSGVHFPVDIVAGILLALTVALSFRAIQYHRT